MPAFLGVERKLSVAVLCAFLFGWLIYLVGFIIMLTLIDFQETTLFMVPWGVAAGGGPVLFVCALLQSGLTGKASSVVGIFSSFLGTWVIFSMGYILCLSVIELYFLSTVTNGGDKSVNAYDTCSFLGTLICTHCWSVNLTLSTLHKDLSTSETNTPKKLFQGVARKLVVLPSVLSFVGWIVLIAGLFTASHTFDTFPTNFPGFGVLFFGPIVSVAMLTHAGSWGGASTAMGIVASFLSTIYTVCVGFFFYSIIDIENISSAIFAGGLISIFCLACALALWPFFQRPGSWTTKIGQSTQVFLNTTASQREPLLQNQTNAPPPAYGTMDQS